MTASHETRLNSLEAELGEGRKVIAFPRSLKPALITPKELEALKTIEDELEDTFLLVYEPDMSLELSRKVDDDARTFNILTPEEERIIVHKGTEPPGTGKYNKFFREGIYRCKRCNTPLFKSDTKFDSGCGWPSFDDAIPGAVKEIPDPDGRRMEIVCAACGGHLGHVFRGEHKTPKDTRMCVNSLSIDFNPEKEPKK
ncbi:methionine-R-sulfoxide reductase [Dehalogenimonas etheniformans]